LNAWLGGSDNRCPSELASLLPLFARLFVIGNGRRTPKLDRWMKCVDIECCKASSRCSQHGGEIHTTCATHKKVGGAKTESVTVELSLVADTKANVTFRIGRGTRVVTPTETALARSNVPGLRRERRMKFKRDCAAVA
jgi:hypothetical protein